MNDLLLRSWRICLACDSDRTTKRGRVLTCSRCEATYFIPAVQLALRPRPAAAAPQAQR